MWHLASKRGKKNKESVLLAVRAFQLHRGEVFSLHQEMSRGNRDATMKNPRLFVQDSECSDPGRRQCVSKNVQEVPYLYNVSVCLSGPRVPLSIHTEAQRFFDKVAHGRSSCLAPDFVSQSSRSLCLSRTSMIAHPGSRSILTYNKGHLARTSEAQGFITNAALHVRPSATTRLS